MEQILAFLPMILVFVLFYFMIIVPDKKRKKQYNSMLDALKVNDEVMTKGGIMGRLVNIQDDYVILESGPDRARIKMSKLGVASVTKSTDQAAADKTEK